MTEFRVNDRVRLTGKVEFAGDDGSMIVRFDGTPATRHGVAVSGSQAAEAELIERPKSPGQIAYEAKRSFLGFGAPWGVLDKSTRDSYEAAAKAVKEAQ